MSPEEEKLQNIRNLKKKIIVITVINATSFILDTGMKYYTSRTQINKTTDNQVIKKLYRSVDLYDIINIIKPYGYQIGMFADSVYLTNNDGVVDTVDGLNDVSPFTKKWPILLLHLTKTAIRLTEFLNTKPIMVDGK